MSYNSQLWFQEGSSQVRLGQDVGYGLGWKLLAGALMPVWSGYDLVYFLFTDSSGAESTRGGRSTPGPGWWRTSPATG